MSGNRNQSADKVLEVELLSSTSELLKLGEEKRSVAGITVERDGIICLSWCFLK